ncbi:MAG: hypothetical protein KIS79_14415 [Burkholderiales bacterium]|nr:hypothetical protein [Burkholderiales bacterium]
MNWSFALMFAEKVVAGCSLLEHQGSTQARGLDTDRLAAVCRKRVAHLRRVTG